MKKIRKNKFIDHQSAVIYAWSLIILKETMNEIGGEDDKFAVYIHVNPLLHISYYRIAFDHLITSALEHQKIIAILRWNQAVPRLMFSERGKFSFRIQHVFVLILFLAYRHTLLYEHTNMRWAYDGDSLKFVDFFLKLLEFLSPHLNTTCCDCVFSMEILNVLFSISLDYMLQLKIKTNKSYLRLYVYHKTWN